MSTYRGWYLSLAGFLLVAGPLPAQESAPPLKMIYAVWKDTSGAASTVKHMTKDAKDMVQAYAVLIKDSTGKVEVRQRHNQAGGSVAALQASQVVDTAIARLSAPLPTAADSASGYAPSGTARRLSDEDLKKIHGMFNPGESALILMSAKPDVSQIERTLGLGAQSNAEIVELEVKQ
jgi:hypothetical protein